MIRRDFLRVVLGGAASLFLQGVPAASVVSKTKVFAKDPGLYATHIQSVKVDANLGRTPLFELGRNGVYHRYVNFPVEISKAIGGGVS